MILAAEHGRIGERYLISERMIAAEGRGADRGRRGRCAARRDGRSRCRCCTRWARWAACGRGSPAKTPNSASQSVRMMRAEADVDHSKAARIGLAATPGARNRSARPPDSGPRCATPGKTIRTAPPRNPNKLAHVERVHVDLNGPPQTMLATLYAKALDADAPARSWGTGTPRRPSSASTTTGKQRYHRAAGPVGGDPQPRTSTTGPASSWPRTRKPSCCTSVVAWMPRASAGSARGCAVVRHRLPRRHRAARAACIPAARTTGCCRRR